MLGLEALGRIAGKQSINLSPDCFPASETLLKGCSERRSNVGPVKKLARPVSLAEIKTDRAFADFPLVRISRLSVMPVTDAEWDRIEQMAR